MSNKLVLAALLSLAGAAQAQTACSCQPGATRTANSSALAQLLANRMVCANVGSERWQEWHNGSAATGGGPIVDYKLGPNVQPDPSATVGSYTVNTDNTVTYNYGNGGGTWTYDVCMASGGVTYIFCGAIHGGRDILNAKIGGTGLQNCDSVVNGIFLTPSGTYITKTR